jgi:hypothetical protein
MSEQKTANAAPTPAEATTEASVAPAAAPGGKPAPAEAKAPAKKPATRKPSRLEETKERNKKALAEALAAARAVKIPPAPEKPVVPKAPVKATKGKQPKLVRDSFTMPEDEYARIATLKKRMAGLGGDVKKSELLRAGLGLLAALQNKELAAVMASVERVKTGRPKK